MKKVGTIPRYILEGARNWEEVGKFEERRKWGNGQKGDFLLRVYKRIEIKLSWQKFDKEKGGRNFSIKVRSMYIYI